MGETTFKRCANCEWVEQLGDFSLVCTHHPPTVYVVEVRESEGRAVPCVTSLLPPTWPDHRCAFWDEREREPVKLLTHPESETVQ